MAMIFYRYEESLFMGEQVKVVEKTFALARETKHGYWITPQPNFMSTFFGKDKWVSKTARKRYAYPTKKEALINFIARKRRQLVIIKWQLDRITIAQLIGEAMLEKLSFQED